MSKGFAFLIFFFSFFNIKSAFGQGEWPTPEAEQLYQTAKGYLMSGAFKQAIVTYRQAITLAPDKMILYRELGRAFYLTKDFDNARKVLLSVVESTEADDQSFEILGNCEAAEGDTKKARITFEKGIERFPQSGLLYHDLGKTYEDDNLSRALTIWLNGIKNDPSYHVNYYEAAKAYSGSNKIIWTILYGEIFINIEHHTPRSNEVRAMLMIAYTKLYNNITADELPKFGKQKKEKPVGNFEDAVYSTFLRLSPVVSEGINTESLTMLRTRFLMDWYDQYANIYPFSLFAYQDDLTRNGYFDIYNEWLFGKAENIALYNSWSKFHPGDLDKLETWMGIHSLHPKQTDNYNGGEMKELFPKKKK